MGQFPSLETHDTGNSNSCSSSSGGGVSLPVFLQQFLFEKFGVGDSSSSSSMAIQNEIITHDKFIQLLTEINSFSKQCLDNDGNQLIFAIKNGTDSSTILWRTTVQIACVKYDQQQQKIISYRLLNLDEFLTICKTLKWQTSAITQSKKNQVSIDDDTPTQTFENSKECCICLERPHEVILPCTHSYCLPCIEQWNEIHDTCPICREKLTCMEDTWELPGIPTANEIHREIQTSLMDLTENRCIQ